jgi:Icc-related predicted phosphoesterase
MPRARRSSEVTLFFATDLHGSELCWRKFVAAAGFYDADLLILGGDFTGKLVVPLVETATGYRAEVMGRTEEVDADGAAALERRIADLGHYPARMTGDEVGHLNAHPDDLAALFEGLICQRVAAWIGYANERLAGTGVRVLTAPANDDPFAIDEVIAEHGGEVFVNVEGEVVEIAPGHELISTGYTNETPWHTPREYPEEVIAAHIKEMAARLDRPENAVFNLHPPPHNSQIDLAPELDADLKVTSGGSPAMVPVGSRAVRAAIEEHQPLLSLHGHIHESPGSVRIGRTVAVNPGSEYGEGVLRGALITLGGGRIRRRQATTG